MSREIVQINTLQTLPVARPFRAKPPAGRATRVYARRYAGPINLLDRILLLAIGRYMKNTVGQQSARPADVDIRA
jgi:hypothetical protein